MSFTSWLRNFRSTVASGRLVRNHRRSRTRGAATGFRPRLEGLEDRCLLAFGAGGVVITDILATSGEWIESIALQTDGRIVAAGHWGGGGDVARYNADGSLDTSFNTGGSQPGTITPPGYLNDVALQADGKIVAGGMTWGSAELSFLVRRFSADGTPDSTFGSNGEVTTNFTKGKTDEIAGLAIQPSDQKIVAVGYSNDSYWTVVRYNTNGGLDTSFDRDGKVTTTFGTQTSAPRPRALVVQSDGKILVAGEVYGGTVARYDFALARYNANGSLDQTFGQGGKVRTDFASERGYSSSNDKAYDMALQADGKIVVVGHSGSGLDRVAIARYNANGSLDSTFDGNGMVILDVQTGGVAHFDAVAIQADGKIVAVAGSGIVLVTRFNADGSLDSSFDGDGLKYFQYDLTQPWNFADDVLVQPDGKILVGGSTGDGEQKFALARLNADGTFDMAAAPLIAAGSLAANPSVDTLTQEQLQPVLAEAIARWQAAGVDTLPLANLTVQIVDLSGGYLGMADGNTIYLDDNAAGWDWFVDATPQNNLEFVRLGNQGEQNRMDLLTVVMHELGHLLGHDHDEAGVMAETLAVGVRRTDMEHDHMALVDQVFDQPVDHHADGWLGAVLDEQLDSRRLWFKRRR